MIIPVLIMIIVILAIYNPKSKTFIIKEGKSLAEKRLEDPLLPPERTHTTRLPINIRTQGALPNYQQIGFVFQESTSTRLPLFGRPEYNGSNKYEYYVKDDGRNMVKIPIDKTDEIYTGDVIDISGYSGDFISEVYDLDEPKYIPYL